MIFGKNSSGKSILLRTWRDEHESSVHYVAPERGGEITVEPGQLAAQQTPKGRRDQTQQNFAPSYRQQVVTRIVAFLAVRGGQRKDCPEGQLDEIERQLNVLLPDFSVSILSRHPHYELVRLATSEKITQVNQLSSGEAHVLTLGLDILTMAATWVLEEQDERLILIDEPDAHLHPDLQVRFADFLSQVGRQYHCQLVIATHSTTLLSALGQFGGDRASVIYMDRARDTFNARLFSAALREIAACLGGHVLMGPLFGAPILLVEGDDDYRIWSQVPRHHCINLAVIPCSGDQIASYRKTLEEIFESLCERNNAPLGYALLDGDKPLPQANPENPQHFVTFIRLNCHEVENLYLTDEVLTDLETNWEDAMELIAQASDQFGEKATLLKDAPQWNRQNDDVKPVIREIAKILDRKNVDWTIRVGQRIGRGRPSGQLMEFLGETLVNALWGPDASPATSAGDATSSVEPVVSSQP